MISSIPPAGTDAATTLSQSSTAKGAASLDYDSFLRMFVAQLQNQDPLNPMEGTEYTAQLAQFSNLEQSIKSNEKLDGLMSQLSLSQANALIGRTATTADGAISGVIETVTILSDGSVANLVDGTKLPLGPGITIK